MNNIAREPNGVPVEISGILSRSGLQYDGWSSENSAVAKVYKVKKDKKALALRLAQLISVDEFHAEIANRKLVENSESIQVKQDVLPHMPRVVEVDPSSKYVLVDWVDGHPLMDEAETLSATEIHQISTELVKYMAGWHTLGRTINDIDTSSKMDRIIVSAKKGVPITWIDLDANTMDILEHQLKVKDLFSQPEFQDNILKFQGIEQVVTILTKSHLNAIIEHVNFSKIPDLKEELLSMKEELTGQLNQSVLEQLGLISTEELSRQYGVNTSTAELLQVMAKLLSIDDIKERGLYLQRLSEKNTILLQPDSATSKEFARTTRTSFEKFAATLPSINFIEEAKPLDINDHLGYIRMNLRAVESLPDVAIKRESIKILEDYGKLKARIIDFLRRSGKLQNELIIELELGLVEGISLAQPRRNMSNVIAQNLLYVLDECLLPKSTSRKMLS